MKLLIVSGLSGSGKSIALDTLEDCGYYCIDNLPVNFLQDFSSHIMMADSSTYSKTAIGIDARNQNESLAEFSEKLQNIRNLGIECEVLFMQAEEGTLLKRYSETRRRHPLTNENLPLKEAIKLEREILKSISQHADLVIDTSRTHYHQLRQLIKNYIGEYSTRHLSVQLQSFGYKNGIPLDADFVFDARSLPNPYWVPELRGLTGKDQAVIEFLQNEKLVQNYLRDISRFLGDWIPCFEAENRSYLTVAVGCTGGQHRSVFLVDSLAQYIKQAEMNVIIRHREIY